MRDGQLGTFPVAVKALRKAAGGHSPKVAGFASGGALGLGTITATRSHCLPLAACKRVIRQFGAIMDVCAAWSGYGAMHHIFFFVVLVALAAWLDSYLNDGFLHTSRCWNAFRNFCSF